MKSIRSFGAYVALLFGLAVFASVCGHLAGCATGAVQPVDPALVIKTGVDVAKVAIDNLEKAGKLDPAKVAELRATADVVLQLVVAAGPVASAADPKLAPALKALALLQQSIATAAPPPVAAASS